MELSDLLELLQKRWKLISIIIVLAVVAAIGFTYMIPTTYSSRIDVYVSRQSDPESESYYTYDGYYSSQASIVYTQTVSGFFRSLHVVQNVASILDDSHKYDKSASEPENMAGDTAFLEGVIGRIHVSEAAPQLLTVEFEHEDREKGELWVKYLGDVVKGNVDRVNQVDDRKFVAEVLGEPITEEVNPNRTLNVLLGLIIGSVLGLGTALVMEYFSKR